MWLDSLFNDDALEILTPMGRWLFFISWAIGSGYVASQSDTIATGHPDFGKPKTSRRRWIERTSLSFGVLGCAIAFAIFGRAPAN